MYLIIIYEIKIRLLIKNSKPKKKNKGWILMNNIEDIKISFKRKNDKIEYFMIGICYLELKNSDKINEALIEILPLRISIKDYGRNTSS